MSENIFQNIKKITRNFKRVNIVTNHLEKFKKIEKQEKYFAWYYYFFKETSYAKKMFNIILIAR